MRQDYEVMRCVATHTRVLPTVRVQETQRLIQDMNSCEEIKQELDLWGISLHSLSSLSLPSPLSLLSSPSPSSLLPPSPSPSLIPTMLPELLI